jgi:hypothetical protein
MYQSKTFHFNCSTCPRPSQQHVANAKSHLMIKRPSIYITSSQYQSTSSQHSSAIPPMSHSPYQDRSYHSFPDSKPTSSYDKYYRSMAATPPRRPTRIIEPAELAVRRYDPIDVNMPSWFRHTRKKSPQPMPRTLRIRACGRMYREGLGRRLGGRASNV